MRTPAPWPATFLAVARALAQKSRDPSTQVGAVLASPDNRILGTGFNGPPPQMNDLCVPWDTRGVSQASIDAGGPPIDKYHATIHGEENALLDALDKHGLAPLKGATMYVTHRPCPGCVLRMIRAGLAGCAYPRPTADQPPPKCVTALAAAQAEYLTTITKPNVSFTITEL